MTNFSDIQDTDNELTSTARVVLAFKRKTVKTLSRRTPSERLKARLYYRRNKIKLKLKRKMYLNRNKSFSKTRKLFKRSAPSWLKPSTPSTTKLHHSKPKKFHVPKRK